MGQGSTLGWEMRCNTVQKNQISFVDFTIIRKLVDSYAPVAYLEKLISGYWWHSQTSLQFNQFISVSKENKNQSTIRRQEENYPPVLHF